MKKLLLILILLPITALASFYPGTITFNDGSTKSGFVEVPDDPGSSKIRFRQEEKGKNEKFAIEDVKGFDITVGRNTYKYETVYLANAKLFDQSEIKIDKQKSWVQNIKQGGITLYAAYTASKPGAGPNPGATSSIANTTYYIKRQNLDYALMFFMVLQSSGTTFAVNNYKALPKMVKYHFEKDCPILQTLIDKEDFKKNGIGRIVDLYDANCGVK